MAARKRTDRLPGEFIKGPTTVEADLGRADGGFLTGKATYTVKTRRLDGQYTVSITWVKTDTLKGTVLDSGTHELPHGLIQRVLAQVEAITRESRRAGARKAADKRQEQGIVPFQKRGAIQ